MKRHPTDIVSLVFGLLFVGLAVTGMFVDDDVSALEARWVWPVLLVAGGLAIVVFSLGRTDPARQVATDEATDEDATTG